MKHFAVVFTGQGTEEAAAFATALKSEVAPVYTEEAVVISLQSYMDRREVHVSYKPELLACDLKEPLSRASASFMIGHCEHAFIESLIQRICQEKRSEERVKMADYTKQLMEEEDEEGGYACRVKRLSQEILPHLTLEGQLNLIGLFRFRLHGYQNELRELAEFAIDEYVMERQYQDFIHLLKYFVYVQETKVPYVHLVHKGDYEFVLLDEQLQPIKSKQMESVVVEMLDQDLNYEDMIVSTLIHVSPKKIYIHTEEPELQVIRTIEQIFESRTHICRDAPFPLEAKRPIPLP
ncbi:sporulation protein YtxC [Marinicrinis sediminis]|uniref:Sporulation protein YtxC n=1 Tax=Marinicrinis sediminis TaxID=1652465 RepID=A0ABW5R8G6_9BACL